MGPSDRKTTRDHIARAIQKWETKQLTISKLKKLQQAITSLRMCVMEKKLSCLQKKEQSRSITVSMAIGPVQNPDLCVWLCLWIL